MSIAKVYILHSEKLNRYYTGMTTTSIDERIKRHNSLYYDNKYTAKADDWQLYLSIGCRSKSQAHSIEKHIKRMKSKKYIENLKKYPEIIAKLLNQYS